MDDRGINNPEEHLEERASPDLPHKDVSTSTKQEESTTPVATQPVVQERMIPVATVQPAFVAAEVPGVKQQANPITLVLQWLTYAFWGWFALAMLWLAFVSFSFFTQSESFSDDWSTVVAYPIAAVVVLFLMAAVTDLFYMRREPAHKTGVATAIMVVHTVIFALCGVGLIVSVVFIVLQMVLNASPDKTLYALLYMALVGVLLYAILVVRTTLVAKVKRLPVIAMGSLGVTALIFVVLCIVGPMMQSLATRQDRQVESALSVVQSAVVSYTNTNKKLPTTLDKLSFDDGLGKLGDADVKALLQKGVIEYTPNVKSVNQDTYGISQDNYMKSSTVMHYYQLCATYTHDKNPNSPQKYSPSASSSYSGDGSSSSYDYDYIDTYSHKAGRQCYTLQAASNDYSVNPKPL